MTYEFDFDASELGARLAQAWNQIPRNQRELFREMGASSPGMLIERLTLLDAWPEDEPLVGDLPATLSEQQMGAYYAGFHATKGSSAISIKLKAGVMAQRDTLKNTTGLTDTEIYIEGIEAIIEAIDGEPGARREALARIKKKRGG